METRYYEETFPPLDKEEKGSMNITFYTAPDTPKPVPAPSYLTKSRFLLLGLLSLLSITWRVTGIMCFAKTQPELSFPQMLALSSSLLASCTLVHTFYLIRQRTGELRSLFNLLIIFTVLALTYYYAFAALNPWNDPWDSDWNSPWKRDR
jgi:hypothetical protein